MRSLFIFDRHGKFQNKINKYGRANNEYLYLDDFCLLTNGEIVIVDGSQKKVLIVDKYGNSLESYNITFSIDAVEALNDSLLVFNGSSTENRVIVWNKNNKMIIAKYIDYTEEYSKRISQPLSKYNDQVLFRHDFSSDVYSVLPNKLEKRFFVDFKEYNIQKKDLKPNPELYNIIFDTKANASIVRFIETDKYIYIKFQCERLYEYPFYMFYSKLSGGTRIITNEYNKDDMSFYFTPPQIITTTFEGAFVSVLLPSYLIESMNNMLGDSSDALQKTKEIFKNFNGSENPILSIYYMKNF